MSNRYANLVGSNKIKDEYSKINTGFDAVQTDIDSISADLSAHKADAIAHLSQAEHNKLSSIEEGAQVNQNAFAKVNGVEADDPSDELTIEGGTGIAVTQNPLEKKVTITATGEAIPGPHGSAHLEFGADPIPYATDTEGGLMSAADKVMLNGHESRLSKVEKITNARKVTNTVKKMLYGEAVKIVCYGDSITYGGGLPTSYPAVLQTILQTAYNNNNITVVNKGHNGWQTDEALANIDHEVIAEAPDLAIVMFGANDFRETETRPLVPVDEYRSNLSAMVEKLVENDIEVILISITPIRQLINGWNQKGFVYSKVVEEVSQKYGVEFINIHRAFDRLFFSRAEYPVELIPDQVHPNESGYRYIAEILAHHVLHLHEATGVLYVDSREEFSVPIAYSPYIKTNLTTAYEIEYQVYKANYLLRQQDEGSYIQFDFYIDVPGMSLILRGPAGTAGGRVNVKDNGVVVKNVNFYAPEAHEYNVEHVLIEELSMGWHSIRIDADDITPNPTSAVYLTDFIFRPVSLARKDRLWRNLNSSPEWPIVEKFTRIVDGTIRMKSESGPAGIRGVLLLSAGSVELKEGKTLIIEAVAKLSSQTGITWFGNDAEVTSTGDHQYKINAGYLLYFTGSAGEVRLYKCESRNSQTIIDTYSYGGSFNYNIEHLIRIEHKDDGTITVYIDGEQIISASDNSHRSGFFGLWMVQNVAIEVSRFEYSYV